MNKVAIVDASPLIVLVKSDLSHILPLIFQSVVISEAAYGEVIAGPVEDRSRLVIPYLDWLLRGRSVSTSVVDKYDLGRGETETIALALSISDSIAILDDAAARRSAKDLNVSLMGTGGVLLKAKQIGLIESLTESLDRVKHAGLWISPELIKLLLDRAGEST